MVRGTLDDEFEGALAIGGAANVVELVIGEGIIEGGITVLKEGEAMLVFVRNLELKGV